jgi:hypothetical protein
MNILIENFFFIPFFFFLQRFLRMGHTIKLFGLCSFTGFIEIHRITFGYWIICYLHKYHYWIGQKGKLFLGSGMYYLE